MYNFFYLAKDIGEKYQLLWLLNKFLMTSNLVNGYYVLMILCDLSRLLSYKIVLPIFYLINDIKNNIGFSLLSMSNVFAIFIEVKKYEYIIIQKIRYLSNNYFIHY